MTLIVKELIIRGIITNDLDQNSEDSMDKEALLSYLDQMQKTLKKECVETILSKLESKKIR